MTLLRLLRAFKWAVMGGLLALAAGLWATSAHPVFVVKTGNALAIVLRDMGVTRVVGTLAENTIILGILSWTAVGAFLGALLD